MVEDHILKQLAIEEVVDLVVLMLVLVMDRKILELVVRAHKPTVDLVVEEEQQDPLHDLVEQVVLVSSLSHIPPDKYLKT